VQLIVNGDTISCEEGLLVVELVRRITPSEKGVAVAVDRAVVPRSAWSDVALHDGAHVEVLVAAAGG
jgi:sulfur carrier protein